MGSYIPSTKAQREQMLKLLGLNSADELFSELPAGAKLNRPLGLDEGKSEMQVSAVIRGVAEKNQLFPTVFRGAGAYRHYIPSIVKQIPAKEEFLTAYTPYQAEISQGVLQSIFEFQTMICELTGMDVSNASVYDGATAAAEAAAMCCDKKRTSVLVSAATNPQITKTVKTYCEGADTNCVVVPQKEGKTDLQALKDLLDDSAACVIMQQPNYFGLLEDADAVGALAHDCGAKFILSCNPVSLAVLKSPAEYGADIAVGDGQPLGLSLSFGGPYLGFMACTTALTRKLPGRIVGETVDVDGKRAYVLTLQAREQHIRREKASSNICSNQALCALTASVYLATMGPEGLRQVAVQSFEKAHYFADELTKIPGFSLKYGEADFFHEFVTESKTDSGAVLSALQQHKILGGLPLPEKNSILWCVTECNTKEEIDRTVQIIKEVATR